MIRPFHPDDLEQVMDIWLSVNLSAHPFIEKAYWEGALDQVRSALPSSDLFVYQAEGITAGFIGITGQVYIAGLFVMERFQSMGIGKRLLDHCKQRYPRLELDVFTENTGALRFYQNNGFHVTLENRNRDFNRMEYHMVWPPASKHVSEQPG